MSDILYAPDRERIVTTNAWAFLHWLRTTRGIDLPDWAALQRWSASDQAAFRASDRRVRPAAAGAAAVWRGMRAAGGAGAASRRWVHDWPSAATCFATLSSVHPPAGREMRTEAHALLPADVAAPLGRLWPSALLIRPLAELLLHADLRPDDRLLVVGAAWPWLAALLEGTTIILAPHRRRPCWRTAAEERATVLVAPAHLVARQRSSAPAADPTSPTCARSSPPAARSHRKGGAASTPGSSPT